MHIIFVKHNEVDHQFKVSEYPHADGFRCKFNVYDQDDLIATFSPDRYGILHLCKDYGHLDEQLMDLVIDQLERLPVHGYFEQ